MVIMSPAFSFQVKGKQWSNGDSVSSTKFYSIRSVYIMRQCMRTISWAISGFSGLFFHHQSKIIANLGYENVSQVCTKKLEDISCFLHLQHKSKQLAFFVLLVIQLPLRLSLINKSVHRFNNNSNGRVKAAFQIVKFWQHWNFFLSPK